MGLVSNPVLLYSQSWDTYQPAAPPYLSLTASPERGPASPSAVARRSPPPPPSPSPPDSTQTPTPTPWPTMTPTPWTPLPTITVSQRRLQTPTPPMAQRATNADPNQRRPQRPHLADYYPNARPQRRPTPTKSKKTTHRDTPRLAGAGSADNRDARAHECSLYKGRIEPGQSQVQRHSSRKAGAGSGTLRATPPTPALSFRQIPHRLR